MARTTLPAATLSIAPGPGTTGLALPASEATSLATFTGLNFVNNGALVLRVCVGASGAGNLTIFFTRTVDGSLPASLVVALANSTNYLLGPWGPSNYNDANGLIQMDMSVVTGNTAGLYFLPGART